MKTYNISYKNMGDIFISGCHIKADNAISALLEFNKQHPGAEVHGLKLND